MLVVSCKPLIHSGQKRSDVKATAVKAANVARSMTITPV